ncbi:DUF4153 domain-containing protein [Qipengyuania marisflavi]|uniref:DUF4153 domain-containing protein n=1 Tax=Qipengyuania marisflavi TaxID=2486356 RepID=A0A5S3P676_9SPHN|nr:DUF4153 domain-containing protein [Qipengyuania marisflavi]TMM48728.1 DUF4153 domain-containing protein [Qipengyuania marisflavi]
MTSAAAATPDFPTIVDWPLRPWPLAALLGVAGLLVHFASHTRDYAQDLEAWRAALTALVFFGPLAAAFTIDRNDWQAPAVLAALVGLVMAGIAWRVARAQDHYADEQFWFAAGVLAIGLALPLFQAGFHRLRWNTSYRQTHFHVWTDAISAAGAMAFTGLSWLLLFLLAELFSAIKIELLRDLVREGWFGWMFSGAAFGAALGVLRNQLKIIGTLQSVVFLVFSLMAVPLAAALALFLLAVVFSGLDVLWAATQRATPLLLSCAVGAFVLVNAVVRDSDAEASNSRVLRIAAFVLALGILPLALLAAVSMGTRISQHGLSPERLWALIAIAVAVAYGAGYFVAALRGRREGWRDLVRRANLHLAVGTCVIAFLLAMPILDFGAISTRDQLARLQSGAVSVEDFDFDALRWDFGDAGRAALAKLTNSDNAKIAELATDSTKSEYRRYRAEAADTRADRIENLRIQFDDATLQDAVRSYVRANGYLCNDACFALDIGAAEEGGRRIVFVQERGVSFQTIDPAAKIDSADNITQTREIDRPVRADQPLTTDSKVEIREWNGRQIYVDGKPLGDPFE